MIIYVNFLFILLYTDRFTLIHSPCIYRTTFQIIKNLCYSLTDSNCVL